MGYRLYKWQKCKESLIRHLVNFILPFVKALKTLHNARTIRKKTVEKVDVE